MKHLILTALLLSGALFTGCAQMAGPEADLLGAVSSGQEATVSRLLNEGANPNAKNPSSWTPLHMAAYSGRLGAARALLEHGADVNARERQGFTPLHWCTYASALNPDARQLAELLLSHGADINARDTEGSTPLFWAVWIGNRDIARMLLDRGADPSLRGKGDLTPREVVERYSPADLTLFASRATQPPAPTAPAVAVAEAPPTTDPPEPPATSGTAEARFGLKLGPVDFTPPEVARDELDNHITLHHYPEREIPLVTILVRVASGGVHDAWDKRGAGEMTADIIKTGGTEALPGDELDAALEARGAELSVETDEEASWFRLSILTEDFEWGMGILADLLANPAFPQAKLDETRGPWIVGLRQRLDRPADVARALHPQLIYGKRNPWGWTETERTLNALTVDDLRAVHNLFYVPDRIKLGIAGDVSAADARRVTAATFGAMEPRMTTMPALPDARPATAPQVVIVPWETTQNQVYIGHEGVHRFDPQKFPLKVMNRVLSGGFSSRLMTQVRSDRGLAYSVYGRLDEGSRLGTLWVQAQTKVESTAETLSLMREITAGMATDPPTPAELDVARQADVNSFVFAFETAEQIVRQAVFLDAFDYPEDYMPTYTDKIQAVTADDVTAAAGQHIHPDRFTILIIGQVDESLRTELEQLAPIREITPEELVSQGWL